MLWLVSRTILEYHGVTKYETLVAKDVVVNTRRSVFHVINE